MTSPHGSDGPAPSTEAGIADNEIPAVFHLENLDQLRAVAEPTRYRMMTLLSTPHTGAQLARIIGIPRARAHYHLKFLEQVGLVFLRSTDQTKNLTELYYQSRGHMLDFANLIPPDSDMQNEITVQSFNAITEFLATMLAASQQSLLSGATEVGTGGGIWFDFDGVTTPEKFTTFVKKLKSLRDEILDEPEPDEADTQRFRATLFLSKTGSPPTADA